MVIRCIVLLNAFFLIPNRIISFDKIPTGIPISIFRLMIFKSKVKMPKKYLLFVFYVHTRTPMQFDYFSIDNFLEISVNLLSVLLSYLKKLKKLKLSIKISFDNNAMFLLPIYV